MSGHGFQSLIRGNDGGYLSSCSCGWDSAWQETETAADAAYAGHRAVFDAPVVTARWSDEVVEAAAEAIDAVVNPNAPLLKVCPEKVKEHYRKAARAALGAIPPDPVIAEIREAWGRFNAVGGEGSPSWDDRMEALTDLARLLADGAGT